MKNFKTTHSILALVLLLATASITTAQNNPLASDREAERLFNITLLTKRVPAILQWDDAQSAARALSSLAVRLWKYGYDHDKVQDLFDSALRKCDSLTGEQEKKLTPCRWQTINFMYDFDKDRYKELVAQLKTPINPYSGVLSDLLRNKKQPDEALELIKYSVERGHKSGLVSFLSQLRTYPGKAEEADKVFIRLLNQSGQLGPDEVLAFSVYPGQSAGRLSVEGNGQKVEYMELPAGSWEELSPEIRKAILGKAVEARRDNEAKTYVMCSLLLPRAKLYAPDLGQSLETCVNDLAKRLPELSSKLKDLEDDNSGTPDKPSIPASFDEELEKVSALPDVKRRDVE